MYEVFSENLKVSMSSWRIRIKWHGVHFVVDSFEQTFIA